MRLFNDRTDVYSHILFDVRFSNQLPTPIIKTAPLNLMILKQSPWKISNCDAIYVAIPKTHKGNWFSIDHIIENHIYVSFYFNVDFLSKQNYKNQNSRANHLKFKNRYATNRWCN